MDRLPTGQTLTNSGSLSVVSSPFGPATKLPAGASSTIPEVFTTPAPDKGSMLAVVGVGETPHDFGFSIGTGDVNRWGAHIPWGDNIIYFDILNDSTGRLTYAHTWGNGAYDVIVLTNGTLYGQRIWLNGTSVANDTEFTLRITASTTFGMGQQGGVATDIIGHVALLATWKRELHVSEIGDLTADPMAMLKA